MKRKERKKVRRFNFKIIAHIVAVILIIVIVILVWRNFFSKEVCENWSCFNSNLRSCDRTKFIGGMDMTFEYNILRELNGECLVDVKLLQGELNNQDSIKLEGKSMTCYLPIGAIIIPEKNIKNCHGLLKEELQEQFIGKLHSYIVQNIGRINLEILDVPTE
ncbi:MAG: hypothetical protein Q8N88_04535 [Nanoarchaeota archaeon]|nr:hypothetical protein [Nanoarchaeota archaeon]